jgi:hypothetical protein
MSTTKVLPSGSEYRVSGGRGNAKSARKKTDIIDVPLYKRTRRNSNQYNLAGSARGGHQLGAELTM